MALAPIAGPTSTPDPSRVTQPGPGLDGVFAKALQTAQQPPATALTAASYVNPMLAHELALSEKRRRDGQARRHGRALLAGLADLQRALLATDDPAMELDRLSALISSIPTADDPGLTSTVRSIAVRVAVEISRRRPV